MSSTRSGNCERCDGKGWYWRVPDGFNPFLAGGWSTVNAMYRQPCGKCAHRQVQP